MWGAVARFSVTTGFAAADLALLSAFFSLDGGRVAFVLAKWALVLLSIEATVRIGRRRTVLCRPRWVADQPRVRAELRRYAQSRRRTVGGALSEAPGFDRTRRLSLLTDRPLGAVGSRAAPPPGSISSSGPTASGAAAPPDPTSA